MNLIVGLGNPGKKYEDTRHNIGYMVVDALATQLGISFVEKNKQQALVARTDYQGLPLLLVKPTTFMNNSGQAVRALVDYYNIELEDIIVVVDDLNLDPGVIRIRSQGSSGGQNGIQSIIEHLGTQKFKRLKVGIGRPEYGEAIHHVLSRFSQEDLLVIEEAVGKAQEACLVLLSQGLNQAMNEYNG